jgi:hypothetical protein
MNDIKSRLLKMATLSEEKYETLLQQSLYLKIDKLARGHEFYLWR